MFFVDAYFKYKNAFQKDAFLPLQWPSDGGEGGVSAQGGVCLGGCQGEGVSAQGWLADTPLCTEPHTGVKT